MRSSLSRSRGVALRRAAVAVGILAGAAWLGTACSAATGAKAGTQCFSTIDCALGLACIPTGKVRTCSSDIAGLETMLDAGLEAQAPTDSSIPKGIYPTDGNGAAVEDAPAHDSRG